MSRPQILNLLYPFVQSGSFQLASLKQRYTHTDSLKCASATSCNMDGMFIDALVQACLCREHTWHSFKQPLIPKYPYIYHRARRRNAQKTPIQTRFVHTSPIFARPPVAQAVFSQGEYEQMLDYYLEPLDDRLQSRELSPLALTLPPPDPHINKPSIEESSPREEFIKPEPAKQLEDAAPVTLRTGAITSTEQITIKHLRRILKKADSSHELIMQAYSALPYPGVSYLTKTLRRLLFRRISVVETKSSQNMLNYLSVVDDMKAANLPMTEAEWNSTIAFTGRCFAKVTATEVELALRSWKEMEHKAKIRSGSVTFNILFDIATKAGKFVLAEMVLAEMQARNLSINRFGRVGIIYYHGLRGDGNGVRKAYRSLVEAGDIVDTVVMNCVIASLIRAGEPSAANLVYERMKAMFSSKSGSPLPLQNWKAARDLGRVLNRAARLHRHDSGRRQRVQDETSLAPNLRTYAILIEHHVAHTGELLRITALLEDMYLLGVPIHGVIFLKLFKGFASHGGVRYTYWTRCRLESVWTALLAALDARTPDVAVRKWMVVWVVRAFAKCTDDRARVLQIWNELGTRWKGDGTAERQAVVYMLGDILRHSEGGVSGI